LGLLIAAIVLVAPAPASAHAFLDHAVPKVGGAVAAPPATVHIWFTQDLEPAFSSIEVVDAAGKRVDKDDSTVQAGSEMLVSLKPLPPGKYKVRWRALSVDTHETTGTFTFTVGAK
jgi:copper resistance protein C